jgi:hypothetical protein
MEQMVDQITDWFDYFWLHNRCFPAAEVDRLFVPELNYMVD